MKFEVLYIDLKLFDQQILVLVLLFLIKDQVFVFFNKFQRWKLYLLLFQECLERVVHLDLKLQIVVLQNYRLVVFQKQQDLLNLLGGVVILELLKQPQQSLLQDAYKLVGITLEHLSQVLLVNAGLALVVDVDTVLN